MVGLFRFFYFPCMKHLFPMEITLRQCTFVVVTTILLLSIDVAKSATITFGYSATMLFDPDNVVGISAETVGEVLDSVVGEGVGSDGELMLVGTFSWDSNSPFFNSNSVHASYANAINGSTVSIGSSTFTADIDEIAANSATSLVGANTDPTSSFCGSRVGCDAVNLRFTPTGNVVRVLNNANFVVRNILTGELIDTSSSLGRDALTFSLGFTDSVAEYFPAVSTQDFGPVNVGGVNMVFVSTSDALVFSDVSLPDAVNFPDLSGIEQVSITLDLNSTQLIEGRLALNGLVTEVSLASGFCNGLPVNVDLSRGDLPTSGPDVILGTVGDDVISGRGGNDTICGLAGNDTINSGNGDDWVDAGPGNDIVEGGNGNDEIYGDSGVDIINGGPDDDELYGESDGDFINGNSGNDLLEGGFGVDQLRGGAGDDVINTGSGGNRGSGMAVTGGAGNDIITGGPGTDEIRGESGNDTILGGDASDSLFGGGGNDIVLSLIHI